MVLPQSQAELSREKSPRKPQQKRALQRPCPHPSSTPSPAPHPHPTLQHRDDCLIPIQTTNHVEHPLVFTQFFPRRRRRFRREEVRGRAEEQHLVGAVRSSGPFASACRALTHLGVGTRVSVTCGCFQEGGGAGQWVREPGLYASSYGDVQRAVSVIQRKEEVGQAGRSLHCSQAAEASWAVSWRASGCRAVGDRGSAPLPSAGRPQLHLGIAEPRCEYLWQRTWLCACVRVSGAVVLGNWREETRRLKEVLQMVPGGWHGMGPPANPGQCQGQGARGTVAVACRPAIQLQGQKNRRI